MASSKHDYRRTPMPTAPYRSFAHYIDAMRAKSGKPTHKFGPAAAVPDYPCQDCDGRGRIVHPDAFNDPVEGHKMSERINCPMCRGDGGVTRNVMRMWWDQIKDKFQTERAQAKKQIALEAKAIVKLNRLGKAEMAAARRLLR